MSRALVARYVPDFFTTVAAPSDRFACSLVMVCVGVCLVCVGTGAFRSSSGAECVVPVLINAFVPNQML